MRVFSAGDPTSHQLWGNTLTDLVSKKPSALERVTGHPAVESALTLIGALSGSPVAALLPILSKSLAAERHKKRVEAMLAEIDAMLQKHEEALRNLTDGQYKLINETVLAVLHTTDTKKLDYLQRVIRNCISTKDIISQTTAFLSRVIRDISADEAEFIINKLPSNDRALRTTRLGLSRINRRSENQTMTIDPDGKDALIVSGLVSLGLLIPSGSNIGDTGILTPSPIIAQLQRLLRSHPSGVRT